MTRLTRRAALGAALAASAAPAAFGQAFPSKPPRFIVPYPAGGIVDIVTRSLAEPMQAELGQTVVVDPRPGANSTLATAMVAQAPADGYTWVMSTVAHVVAPQLQTVSYNALTDFQPVALVAIATSVAAVNPALPVKTLTELVAYGRKNPDKLTYLNPGNGSSIHLSAELLKNHSKFGMTSVPYRGIPPGMPDLLEGRVNVGLLPGPLAHQHVQTGKLRPLAVLASRRLSTMPDVPTFAEAGFADAQVLSWYVISVRAGTPPDIVNRLHAAATKALQSADTQDRLAKAGCEIPPARSPAELTALFRSEHDRFGKLIKDAGIKADG